MGGAPSRETLVRHIVRDPRFDGAATPATTRSGSCSAESRGGSQNMSAGPQTPSQPEIVLIPLIPDYFPSSASPLFQQLLHVRREANVMYYYRDARSTATEHTVVRDHIGSDKDMYNWYMSLSEQRFMETDNELIALGRAGRVVSPVPCAVAFVYDATATVAGAGAASPANSNGGGGGKRKGGASGKSNRPNKAGATGSTNSFMTIENTVRLPHHSMRVRIFGFVGDTRFCPPSMQPSQAAKLPMCLTIFLSKSAGGNHRAQVTLLAAHTYITQMQAIGVLPAGLEHAATATSRMVKAAGSHPAAAQGRRDELSSAVGGGRGIGRDADPLAALRLGGVGGAGQQGGAGGGNGHGGLHGFQDPYADPYAADYVAAARDATDPYALAGDDGAYEQQRRYMTPPVQGAGAHGGVGSRLGGLGCSPPSTGAAADAATETVLRRPIEIVVHRADVPALCYLRELRARMDQGVARAATPLPAGAVANTSREGSRVRTPTDGSLNTARSAASDDANPQRSYGSNSAVADKARAGAQRKAGGAGLVSVPDTALTHDGGSAHQGDRLKFQIRTVVEDDELRGSVAADAMGRVLMWASCFYYHNFDQLIGGEAAKLRQELAQRNLIENPLDGVLSFSEEEPRPPASVPRAGDVWIPPQETYVDLHGAPFTAAAAALGQHWMQDGGDGWARVPGGTVLRCVSPHKPSGNAAAGPARWVVSPNEFAEDVLLSLCRQACQASRRAPPTDSHWLLNRDTGLPEGLSVGLVIWREPCAGQVVYYGTTPEFLKKWVQSGAEVEQAYRNHVKRPHPGRDETSPTQANVADDAAVAHRSSSVAVVPPAVVTAGLHSSYDPNAPTGALSHASGGSSGPAKSGSSGGDRARGSGPDSLALYGVHTGFVSTPDQVAAVTTSLSGKESLVAAPAATAAAAAPEDGAKAKRQRTDEPRRASVPVSLAPADPAPITLATRAPANISAPRQTAAAGSPRSHLHQGPSVPTHQLSRFAIPVPPSAAFAATAALTPLSSGEFGTPTSYPEYVPALGNGSFGSSNSTSLVFRQLQPPNQQQHPLHSTAASACWIGLPEEGGAPTVNVTVKQRRGPRSALGSSQSFGSGPAVGTPHHQGSGVRSTPLRFMASREPPLSGRRGSVGAAPGGAAPLAHGSMPVRIPGAWDSSSGEESMRHGGHSSTSVEQSRSLLRVDEALLSNSHLSPRVGSSDPRRETAGQAALTGPLSESVGSPRWTTSSAAQPSSMRGASVTFAGGSVSSPKNPGNTSLLHASRHHEPYQPVAASSRPYAEEQASMAACSVTSTGSGSSSQMRRKDSVRPPPLLEQLDDAGGAAAAAAAGKGGQQFLVQHSPLPYGGPAMSKTAPVAIAPRLNGLPMPGLDSSLTGAAAVTSMMHGSDMHTPHQSESVNSAKSSVGSNKYRWDWRGVSRAA